MPVTTDIVASYRRGPRHVMRRLLSMGGREDRLLVFALLAGLMAFIGQTPWQARLAYLDSSVPLEARLYWSAFFWIFVLPLCMYVLAYPSCLICRVFGMGVSPHTSRLALFWAALASSPLGLLLGLVAGFIGPGAELTAVRAIWVAVFLWFWLSNLREAGWSTT